MNGSLPSRCGRELAGVARMSSGVHVASARTRACWPGNVAAIGCRELRSDGTCSTLQARLKGAGVELLVRTRCRTLTSSVMPGA